jgi:hypothetical protein
MNEILKKIDERLGELKKIIDVALNEQLVIATARVNELYYIRKLIASSYPTETTCKINNTGCTGYKDGKCVSIENCYGKVEQPVITIGDKIRESNENLAEFALEVQSDTEHGEVWGTVERCEQYLNQPYTEK